MGLRPHAPVPSGLVDPVDPARTCMNPLSARRPMHWHSDRHAHRKSSKAEKEKTGCENVKPQHHGRRDTDDNQHKLDMHHSLPTEDSHVSLI